MRPEMPYLAAGAIAIAGGTAREKAWPHNGTSALLATGALVVVASATANSPVAPLVHAVGILVLLAAVLVTVPKLTVFPHPKTK